jgi:DnaJ-class molecular chaperone
MNGLLPIPKATTMRSSKDDSVISCPICNGAGADVDVTCPDCHGTGYDPQEEKPFAQCHTCYGEGEITLEICPHCNGDGETSADDSD